MPAGVGGRVCVVLRWPRSWRSQRVSARWRRPWRRSRRTHRPDTGAASDAHADANADPDAYSDAHSYAYTHTDPNSDPNSNTNPDATPTPTPEPTPSPSPSNSTQEPPAPVRHGITPLGWYVMGSVACAAVSPIVGTIVLGREMTLNEVYRSTFGCVLGPLGWLLADALVPPGAAPGPPPGPPPQKPPPRRTARGRNISIPPRGATDFVADEVLFETAGASPRGLALMARRLQLTHVETYHFTLLDRTLQRWRITGNASVPTTLRGLGRYRFIVAAQANRLYRLHQQPARLRAKPAPRNMWCPSCI